MDLHQGQKVEGGYTWRSALNAVVPPTRTYGSVSVPHASAAPSVMLVAGKRTDGRKDGKREERSHITQVKRSIASWIMIPLGSQSEASHHWGTSAPVHSASFQKAKLSLDAARLNLFSQ